jgi:uncharacterized membrane protein YraQ (UPF0718 family)
MRNNKRIKKKIQRGVILTLIGLITLFTVNEIKYNTISINRAVLENFTIIFLSTVLEALPFIILGSFVSALIQVFISDDTISKFLPKNKFVGLIVASFIGLIFPVCECAIVPITRKLIKKGMPLSIGITFMLSVPIVNPIVLISTYYAFYDIPSMVIIRGVGGIICSVIIGYIIGRIYDNKEQLKAENIDDPTDSLCMCGYEHKNINQSSRFTEIIEHTNHELYDIGRYLIAGAMISAVFQTFISRNIMLSVGQHKFYSIVAMIVLAYIISLCSEADAFIARSFVGQFTGGSIAAFLIFGPMIDIKNTLMLLGVFNSNFVIKLIVLISTVCFAAGLLVNYIGVLR